MTIILPAEVEILCHKNLHRALTLRDAKIEDGDNISDMKVDVGVGRFEGSRHNLIFPYASPSML